MRLLSSSGYRYSKDVWIIYACFVNWGYFQLCWLRVMMFVFFLLFPDIFLMSRITSQSIWKSRWVKVRAICALGFNMIWHEYHLSFPHVSLDFTDKIWPSTVPPFMKKKLTNRCNFQTCYVSQDFSKEMEEFTESDSLAVDMSEFDLPTGDK